MEIENKNSMDEFNRNLDTVQKRIRELEGKSEKNIHNEAQ